MDHVVLAAAGQDLWKLLAENAVLRPASFFLAYGARVGFNEKEAGVFVVTGYEVSHSGFNQGTNVAFPVNIACTGWIVRAIELAAHCPGKVGMKIPSEKLLVLSALKLADGTC